ncbi:MAG TPA: sulfite exporter TauE/SafE family protein, partial [Verrucomicrobiae bacterium]|nr:sulfite exporter TauE/SafE family protein [Verrucomicrobiae bacterium]
MAAAAAAAGMVNAVAGGGTLITFPTLLLFGVSPITANATSTLALFFGTVGSITGYRKHLAAALPWFMKFGPVSAIGGVLGGLILTRSGDTVFAHLAPFLSLFATVLFVLKGVIAPHTKPGADQGPSSKALWGALAFQFLVALYGGYFGAGIGILMLATLGLMGLRDIHEMNTLKTLLATLINLVASVWFVANGLVDWPRAGVMTAGALCGFYTGAH